jgi:hypothetical protein
MGVNNTSTFAATWQENVTAGQELPHQGEATKHVDGRAIARTWQGVWGINLEAVSMHNEACKKIGYTT